jgi:hypothetical protein
MQVHRSGIVVGCPDHLPDALKLADAALDWEADAKGVSDDEREKKRKKVHARVIRSYGALKAMSDDWTMATLISRRAARPAPRAHRSRRSTRSTSRPNATRTATRAASRSPGSSADGDDSPPPDPLYLAGFVRGVAPDELHPWGVCALCGSTGSLIRVQILQTAAPGFRCLDSVACLRRREVDGRAA